MAKAEIEVTTLDDSDAGLQQRLAERLMEMGLLLALPSPLSAPQDEFHPVPVEGISVSELLLQERC